MHRRNSSHPQMARLRGLDPSEKIFKMFDFFKPKRSSERTAMRHDIALLSTTYPLFSEEPEDLKEELISQPINDDSLRYAIYHTLYNALVLHALLSIVSYISFA